jgi:hypothetical protein
MPRVITSVNSELSLPVRLFLWQQNEGNRMALNLNTLLPPYYSHDLPVGRGSVEEQPNAAALKGGIGSNSDRKRGAVKDQKPECPFFTVHLLPANESGEAGVWLRVIKCTHLNRSFRRMRRPQRNAQSIHYEREFSPCKRTRSSSAGLGSSQRVRLGSSVLLRSAFAGILVPLLFLASSVGAKGKAAWPR